MTKKGESIKSGGIGKRIKKFIPIYILALPGLIYLFINNYVPMAGLIVAFKNYSAKRGLSLIHI